LDDKHIGIVQSLLAAGRPPLQLVVLAVEQAAQQSGMPITEIWRNVERLAAAVCYRRPDAWVMTGLGANP
jgi:hypothetical protein